MVVVAQAIGEKQLMVSLWASLLTETPESVFNGWGREEVESVCARGYDAYIVALRGDYRPLDRFVKEMIIRRKRHQFGTGDILRALWAFRNVALIRQWSMVQLLSLDNVIHRTTVAFAEALDDLRTEGGYLAALTSLATALEAKDKYTSMHCQTVQRIGEIIADDLGTNIGYAGLFHDLGKIHVPDYILNKPGKLTAAEYAVVKQHAIHAYRMLSPLPGPLPLAVLGHHERPDGRGYPLGLSEVPMSAAVVAVADTLHAIVSDRPYQLARPFREAVEIINEVKGTQLRDEPVEAFNRVRDDILREIEAEA